LNSILGVRRWAFDVALGLLNLTLGSSSAN
jgi:hypothetical protein